MIEGPERRFRPWNGMYPAVLIVGHNINAADTVTATIYDANVAFDVLHRLFL